MAFRTGTKKALLISLVPIALAATAPWAAAAPFFQGLGSPGSGAMAVSSDGSVVVGWWSTWPLGEYGAFRWTQAGGMIGLGRLPGATSGGRALGVSCDGSVVVGECYYSPQSREAFRWTQPGGMEGLGYLWGGSWPYVSAAEGVSADGSVIVGNSSSPLGQQAFRWTEAHGFLGLGYLRGGLGGYPASFATAVSADGAVVVGTSSSASGGQAYRWTEATRMVGLGDLRGGYFYSAARAVSADGSVVVGESYSGAGWEAFRWTQADGMVGLGDLPGGQFWSGARGVSAEGSVVVGYGTTGYGYEAFHWTQEGGMRRLEDVLVNDYSLSTTGWVLTGARGVSADGKVIVGEGVNPRGLPEAWIANLRTDERAARVLSGVPDYKWNYGCSPTAGGVLIGYWDQPGRFEGLVPGGEMPLYDGGGRDGDADARHDAAPSNRDGRAGPRLPGTYNLVDRVIASEGHIRDYWMGDDDGYDGVGPTGDPFRIFGWDRHQDNSIADFMRTSRDFFLGGLRGSNLSDGATWPDNMGSGLLSYVKYSRGTDDIGFRVGNIESNPASAFGVLTQQIDSGWPVLVNIYTSDWAHSIVAYGYIEDSDGRWIAVRDTWQNHLSWPSSPYVSSDMKMWLGHEWWKWDSANFGISSMITFWPSRYTSQGACFVDMGFNADAAAVWGTPFGVDPGSGMGNVEIVSSPLGDENDVLRFSQPDPGSFVAMVFESSVAELTGLSFDYLFDTEGKFTVTLDDKFLIELACPESGPGSIGADDFATFSGLYSMGALGLDTDEMHTWRIELSAWGDPVAYIDNIRVWNGVPEPASLVLLLGGLAALARRRRLGPW